MAEEYQSLYRKYRPQVPEDVLGQEHVVRALVGAVQEGRLAHAFLFCGPRGTGKTSTARILAKMVNCEKGPTAEPCGECEQCIRIREGTHLDVVEIDAASHGGVDDARELRERAPTAPAVGREKVYIIDEAQRLSREAFDALLKVFEEPPPAVRFILATTEPHKMPATIIGRCQRFDFRRVPAEVLAAHLVGVASKEGITLAGPTAEAIARHSEGSVRDALSLMDQAALLGGGQIESEVLEALLGAPPSEVQSSLADALAVADARAVFGIVNGLVQEGRDLRHVTADTLEHFRNLLLANTAPGDAGLVDVTPDEYERIRTQAAKFSPAEISRVIALLLDAQADMRWTTSPRLTLELALIRATLPDTDPNPAGLVSRIERLERLSGIEPSEGRPAARDEVERSAGRASEPAAVEAERADSGPRGASEQRGRSPDLSGTKAKPVGVDIDTIRKSWPDVVARLRDARQMILATNLESVTPMSFDGDTLELVFPPDRKFGVTKVEGRQDDLKAVLQEVFGISPKIKCETREAVASDVTEEAPLSEEEALAKVQAELKARVATDREA
ncbi:MAG: DNA polymerase III subunit gamma/tau [Actinomycetota bacterium]